MKAVDLERCPPVPLCRLTGWTKETLSQRVKDGIAVKVGRGLYDAVTTLKNERALQEDRRRSVTSLETARLKAAQAERVEMENRMRRRELVPQEEVQELCAVTMATVAQMLGALDKRLPSQVVGQTNVNVVRAKVREEVNAVRQAAADKLNALAELGEKQHGTGKGR